MNENRYGFICDTKITKEKIPDERETFICRNCKLITGGYEKKEEFPYAFDIKGEQIGCNMKDYKNGEEVKK